MTECMILQIDSLKNMKVSFFVSEDRYMDGVHIPVLCHGDSLVYVVDGTEDISACDALSTEQRDFKLGITSADCAAVCFGDGTKIAVAHIGWRGLCLGLIEKMLTEFDTTQLEIFVGPHLHTFEIQKDSCYETIKAKFAEKFFSYVDGKMLFHFKDAIASFLPSQALFDERNTETDLSIPSHRRNGTTERLITVVSFKD